MQHDSRYHGVLQCGDVNDKVRVRFECVNVLVASVKGPARRVEVRFFCGDRHTPQFLCFIEGKHWDTNKGIWISGDNFQFAENRSDLAATIRLATNLSEIETLPLSQNT